MERGAELANEIDGTDIDAEFERRRGDERFEFAALKRFSASSRSLAERLP